MKKNIRIFILSLVFILLIANAKGVAMGSSDYKEQIKEKFRQIDISDGVSKEEAVIIAQNELIKEGVEKEFHITKPVIKESNLINNCWLVIFKAKFRFFWSEFHIDKKTGEIKASGGSPDL